MTKIILTTEIQAGQQTVFDLARNIDIHQLSTDQTQEKAIAGRTSGLISLDETVTWQGRHFGFLLTHKSKITSMELYDFFTDIMTEGCFKSFHHEHIFREENGTTIMVDELEYETPFGLFGKIFDCLILKKHMLKLLLKRNAFLKETAEKGNL